MWGVGGGGGGGWGGGGGVGLGVGGGGGVVCGCLGLPLSTFLRTPAIEFHFFLLNRSEPFATLSHSPPFSEIPSFGPPPALTH